MIQFIRPYMMPRTSLPRSKARRAGAGMRPKQRTAVLAALLSLLFLSSCSGDKDKPLIIWTDSVDFASYVELFNATHKDMKAVLVYKSAPASALPPAKDELPPDLVIGSWLKNSTTRKNFTPLDYMLREQRISRPDFYAPVFDYGNINEKQYLLPVCFNLPAMVFSRRNENLLEDSHFVNPEQVRSTAASFNEVDAGGVYTAMGYAPSWDEEFMYAVTKLYGAGYREKGSNFSWNAAGMRASMDFLREWTQSSNTDTASEQNFQFKYLYVPKYKQVSTGRCLFAFMSSGDFFSLTDEQSSPLTFRWLEQDGKIIVQDEIVTMGLYKRARNVRKAEKFMGWFTKEETQRDLILRTKNMKLSTESFGIAGGFSALKSVNEKIYPTYHRQLLGNLPEEEYLVLPNILPPRWPGLKQRVILPCLKESTSTESYAQAASLEDRIADWTKQYF